MAGIAESELAPRAIPRAGLLSSGEAMPCQRQEIGGEDGSPYVGVEAGGALPHAAREPDHALQERDPALDASAEVAELAIDPAALDHVENGEPAPLGEADVLDTERFGIRQVVFRCKAAVETGLARGRAVEALLRGSIGRVQVESAGFPFGIAQSSMRPEAPPVRKILCP